MTQLILDPTQIILEANGKQSQFVNVIYLDASGRQAAEGNASTFVVTDTSVATVDASGTVRAVAPGSTVLTVTFNGVSQTAPITVTQYA